MDGREHQQAMLDDRQKLHVVAGFMPVGVRVLPNNLFG